MKKFIWAIATTTATVSLTGISLSNSQVAAIPNHIVNENSQHLILAKKSEAQALKLEIVTNFADNVIIPTYQELLEQANTLSQLVDTFVSNPNQANLQAARQAWIEARYPWEQSEAFAFGPADSLGYDGDLDDWPVNEVDVQGVLSSKEQMTLESIADLQTTQKGFHTIEFLLFGSDNDKQVEDFSASELLYLQLLATSFQNTSQELLKSWNEGVDGNPPYREVLVTAGNADNPSYLTVEAAFEEIIQGMIGCLDEVGNEKIGIPLEAKNTDDLESRFSHSSLNDFKNNLLSVRNAYLGRINKSSKAGKSLSSWVAKKNPLLDQKVKQQLRNAITAIEAIPNPIEVNMNNPQALAKMEIAQTAVLELFTTMEEEILPLVKGS